MNKILQFFILMNLPLIVLNSQELDRRLFGDWVSEESRYIVSFTDSTIGTFDHGDFEFSFTKNDTIFFEEKDIYRVDYSNFPGEWPLRVLRIRKEEIDTLGTYIVNCDSLYVNLIGDNPFRYGYKEYKRINFRRLKQASEIVFDSIYFESGHCTGPCPTIEIKLYASGFLKFKAVRACEELGSFSGNLSDELMTLIQKKLNQLNFDSYQPKYNANSTEDYAYSFSIFGNNDNFIFVGGHEDEPLEVNVLAHYFNELHKWVPLKKESVDYYFPEINRFYRPIPTPPDHKSPKLLK